MNKCYQIPYILVWLLTTLKFIYGRNLCSVIEWMLYRTLALSCTALVYPVYSECCIYRNKLFKSKNSLVVNYSDTVIWADDSIFVKTFTKICLPEHLPRKQITFGVLCLPIYNEDQYNDGDNVKDTWGKVKWDSGVRIYHSFTTHVVSCSLVHQP